MLALREDRAARFRRDSFLSEDSLCGGSRSGIGSFVYGFTRLSMRDPYKAPIGAVIVYGNKSRGHVEIRTRDGFVSDYHSKWACYYPVQAVYAKL